MEHAPHQPQEVDQHDDTAAPQAADADGGRPWYKRWWGIPTLVVAALVALAVVGGGEQTTDDELAAAKEEGHETGYDEGYDDGVADADASDEELAAAREEGYDEGYEDAEADAAEEIAALEDELAQAGDAEPDAEETADEAADEATEAGEERVVQEFSGSGQHTTRPFTVDDGWEIQWDFTGDILQIYINDDSGGLAGVAANEQGESNGSAYQARGGTYHLEMNAMGQWTVRVVELP